MRSMFRGENVEMNCAYCGKVAKKTKEHIISCSVLDLFPECFATIDNNRGIVHLSDPVINDVCARCNNTRISYIDSYAQKFISDYFVQKYGKDDSLDIIYNYDLVQKMLLKYAFNTLRSIKHDVSFFTPQVKEFLMTENINEPLRNVTVLAGLAVNTSPAPDYMFGNIKIRSCKNPIFLSNSIIEHIDYETGKIQLRNENSHQEFAKIGFSFLFRFNSGQFLLICWDDDISDDDLIANNTVLQFQYPYTVLDNQGYAKLSRCTSEATYHSDMLIDVIWGQGIFDEITLMRGTYSDESQQYLKETEANWQLDEENLAKRFPR